MSDERLEEQRQKLPPPLDGLVGRIENSFDRLGTLVPNADILGQPSGPYPDCFSPMKIVNMFFAGATEQDLIHMGRCALCSLKLIRYGQLTNQNLPKEVPQGLVARVKALLAPHQAVRPAYCAALLHLSHPVIDVRASDPNLEFTCNLLVGIEGSLPKLNGPSIEVAGPIRATGATVSTSVFAGKELLRVRFERVVVADYVRRDLENHPSVSDTLFIRICLPGWIAA